MERDLIQRLSDLSEANADRLTEFWVQRHGRPDNRGMWKERALKAERENATLRADLEQSRSVEETTHGLYQFWNKKAAELSASNDALRAERDEARRKTIEEAARVAESATLLINYAWAPGPVRTPIDHRNVIAAAIRNMGGEDAGNVD